MPDRSAAGGRLTVLDALDAKPVAGACLLVADQDSGSILREEVLAEANEQGEILWGSLHAEGRTVIARAAGYVPQAFTGDLDGDAEVRLERATRLRVRVVDEYGRAVPDCHVFLSPKPIDDLLSRPELPAPGVGHPLGKRPVWVAVTAALGEALIDELPAGRFLLNVVHELLVPLMRTGADSVLNVHGTDVDVVVTMQEPYGVVFARPGDLPIRSLSWSVSTLGLDCSPQVVSRIARSRGWLERRFPDCLVYLHRPRQLKEPVRVGCSVVLEDETLWTGEWPLERASSIANPVFLEQFASSCHELTLHLLDSDGKEFTGILLALKGEETGFRVQASTGTPFLLPYDTYRVAARGTASMFQAFEGRTVEVREDSSRDMTIRLPEPFVEFVIRPHLPTDEVLAPLEVYIDGEGGAGGVAVVNWRPSRGPIRRLLNLKRFSVRVRSVAYEDIDILEREVTGAGPVEIDLELVEKAR